MSFQSKITNQGTNTIPSYSDQIYAKQDTAAAALFDGNLENEVRKQLKAAGIIPPDLGTPEWDTFIATRLTQFTITGTDTSVISLDATLDGGFVVTDIGTVLVQWEGKGYSTVIGDPVNTIKTF